MDEMKKINVLYLSYDGMTDPLGQSQVLPYLFGLTKKGYNFHIISFEKQERVLQFKHHIQQLCNENNVVWHPLKYSQKSPLVTTVYDVTAMKRKAIKLQKEFNFKIVHCRSYISALVGVYMKKRFHTKFVFDMRGFWADERVDGGLWDLENPIYSIVYKYFKRKELIYFKEADYTISLTHNGKREIESWKEFGGNTPKIQVIPCCVDLDLFNPDKIDLNEVLSLKKDLNIDSTQKVLGYVGSIGTWYMLSEMLDYFKVFLTKNENSIFLFVTGEKPQNILEEAQQKGITENNIRITSCLHKQVPTYISIFSESIFFIRPTFSKKASSPTKQGEIMAMGMPLVCNSGVGDTDEVVMKYKAGGVINHFENESYKALLENQLDFNKEEMQKGAKEFYSLANGIQKYLEVYQSILTN